MDENIKGKKQDIPNNSVSIFRPEDLTLLRLSENLSEILPEKILNKELDVKHTDESLNLWIDFEYKKKKKKSATLYPYSEFIDDLSLKNKNYILYLLGMNEFMLLCLPITNLESKKIEVPKNSECYFIQTTEKRLILITDKEGTIDIIDIDEEIFDYKDIIGKDKVCNDTFSFYTEFFNDKTFSAVKDIITKRSRQAAAAFADILVLKNNAATKQIAYLKKLYNADYKKSNDNISKLKEVLITFFPKRKFTSDDNDHTALFQCIDDCKDFSPLLLGVLNDDWQIKGEEQKKLLDFILGYKELYHQDHISLFYTSVFEAYKETDTEEGLDFKLAYLHYLKETKQFEIAIPRYETMLLEVVEDSLLDILANNKINLLDGNHANQLRIQLLEDLVWIKSELDRSIDDELLQLSTLQPLSNKRITNLLETTTTTIYEKAKNISAILTEISLEKESRISVQLASESYVKEELFEAVVPEAFKKKQDFLQTLTNLIAQIDPPDYTKVLEFSEKATASNQPDLYEIFKETAKTLSVSNIECFIGRGNYSNGIIGVEGTTNFLIVGSDHLDKQSSRYLSPKELQFSISLELSHILFEHTRLTSKDIWRGAKNKSLNVAQALLVALPILGTLGSVVGKYASFSYLNKMIHGIDRVNNVIDKGQTAVEYGGKFKTLIGENEEKEQNLLATSRLMEISADRVGLLVTKDIFSSINAILKTDPDFEEIKKSVEQEGIVHFLKQQNDALEYLHHPYVIRLKMLFSFYLTSDQV